MKQGFKITFLVGLFMLGQLATAEANLIQARNMNSEQWSNFFKQGQAVTVEFRQGDEIPVSFAAQGDLLETTKSGISYVQVKKNFWMKLLNNDVVLSLDGTHFKPINQVIGGSFSAEAGAVQSGLPVNAIELTLKALLK